MILLLFDIRYATILAATAAGRYVLPPSYILATFTPLIDMSQLDTYEKGAIVAGGAITATAAAVAAYNRGWKSPANAPKYLVDLSSRHATVEANWKKLQTQGEIMWSDILVLLPVIRKNNVKTWEYHTVHNFKNGSFLTANPVFTYDKPTKRWLKRGMRTPLDETRWYRRWLYEKANSSQIEQLNALLRTKWQTLFRYVTKYAAGIAATAALRQTHSTDVLPDSSLRTAAHLVTGAAGQALGERVADAALDYAPFVAPNVSFTDIGVRM